MREQRKRAGLTHDIINDLVVEAPLDDETGGDRRYGDDSAQLFLGRCAEQNVRLRQCFSEPAVRRARPIMIRAKGHDHPGPARLGDIAQLVEVCGTLRFVVAKREDLLELIGGHDRTCSVVVASRQPCHGFPEALHRLGPRADYR